MDGKKETLEDLLERITEEHADLTINWTMFICYFSKGGRSKQYGSPNDKSRISGTKKSVKMSGGLIEVDEITMKTQKCMKKVTGSLKHKQELVPKAGKGKYNVTLP